MESRSNVPFKVVVANFCEKEVVLHKNQVIGKAIPKSPTGVYPIDGSANLNKEINKNPHGLVETDRDDAKKQLAEKSDEHATTAKIIEDLDLNHLSTELQSKFEQCYGNMKPCGMGNLEISRHHFIELS